MSRDDAVYVGHMLDTARKAVEKIDRTSRAAFDSDENLRLALAYLIQIIGEAANRVTRSSMTTWVWTTTSCGRL